MENQNNILTAPAPPKRLLWKVLNDAIQGTDADYTKIDLKKAIKYIMENKILFVLCLLDGI